VSLEKPDHLRPGDEESLFAKRTIATFAAMAGALSFLVVAAVHHQLNSTPDWKISLPGFAVTVLLAIFSIVRKEPKGYLMWGVGILLAGAALFLGWFLMLAIVIVATVVVLLIMNTIL
jgi:hypothetical protein